MELDFAAEEAQTEAKPLAGYSRGQVAQIRRSDQTNSTKKFNVRRISFDPDSR